jgi:hypothetical protein
MGEVHHVNGEPFAVEISQAARIDAASVPGTDYLLVKLEDQRGCFQLIIARAAAVRLAAMLEVETT